jgi:hypothetical protein
VLVVIGEKQARRQQGGQRGGREIIGVSILDLQRPFSVNTARHGSPSVSGGYTGIPESSSITGRAG